MVPRLFTCVTCTSIISDMKQSGKNRQVIAGFGTQTYC